MRCHKYGKPKATKTIEQQEAAVDDNIGKTKGPKRQTNVTVKMDCQCVMVVKQEDEI